jgi:hypothetical protein
MKTLASTFLAAAFCAATLSAASACPYSNKQASSLTDGGSYETAQKDQTSSSKTR